MLTIGKHSKLRTLLSSYLDGEVSEAEARDIERHLDTCEGCRSELESLRATVGLLRQLPQLAVPRSFRLREAPGSTRAGPSWAWPTRLAASLAGLLLIVLLAGDAIGVFTQAGGTMQESALTQLQREARRPGHPAQEMAQDSEANITARAKSEAAPAPPAVAPAPQAATPAPQPQPAATPTPAPVPFMAAAAPAARPEGDSGPAGLPGPETQAAQATPAPYERSPETQQPPAAAMQAPAPAPEAAPQGETTPSPDMSALYATSEEVATPAPMPDTGPRVAQEAGGIRLPLWQMEAAMGALFVLLLAVSIWIARRLGRQSRASG